jgi:dihydropteroate synthase
MILMGVVNLTPDSFREETRAMTPAAIRRRVKALLGRGCSIIDFGAVSTRPGAADVPVETEWQRLEPALALVETAGVPSQDLRHPRLRGGTVSSANGGAELAWACGGASEAVGEGTPAVSIDTTSAEIVRRVYGRIGRFIVNDISSGEDDPAMLPTVAELGLPYIAMHKRGNPRSMDALTDYPQGVVKAVDEYFEQFAAKAEALGIDEWILDPGFGFAKTAEQNWELLENLPALRHFGRPILVGVADKRFTHTPNPFAPGQYTSSEYAERLAAERGADILRIH